MDRPAPTSACCETPLASWAVSGGEAGIAGAGAAVSGGVGQVGLEGGGMHGACSPLGGEAVASESARVCTAAWVPLAATRGAATAAMTGASESGSCLTLAGLSADVADGSVAGVAAIDVRSLVS